MSMKNKNCRNCAYSYADGVGQHYCIYILIERKRRPCEGGDKCTVKRKFSDMTLDERIQFRRKRERYLSIADYRERRSLS